MHTNQVSAIQTTMLNEMCKQQTKLQMEIFMCVTEDAYRDQHFYPVCVYCIHSIRKRPPIFHIENDSLVVVLSRSVYFSFFFWFGIRILGKWGWTNWKWLSFFLHSKNKINSDCNAWIWFSYRKYFTNSTHGSKFSLF